MNPSVHSSILSIHPSICIDQVTFSMLEIYNEQVRDLLNPASLKIKGGLKVRQHSNKGFYGNV